jgi:hypothetical protein
MDTYILKNEVQNGYKINLEVNSNYVSGFLHSVIENALF